MRLSKTTCYGLLDGSRVELVERVHVTSKILNARALVANRWDKQQDEESYTVDPRLEQVDLLAELVDEDAALTGFTDGLVRLNEGRGRAFAAVFG